MILFTFGIAIGFLRNNSNNLIQNDAVSNKPLITEDKNQKDSEKDFIKEIKKNPSNELKTTPEQPATINPSELTF